MKAVIHGKDYPLGDLTRIDLGEQRMMKRILGMSLHEVPNWDPRDPDVATAMLWLAMHRNRRVGAEVSLEEIERLYPTDIAIVADPEDEKEEAATSAVPPPVANGSDPNANGQPPGNDGHPYGSETHPETSGAPPSNTGSA